MRRLMRSLLAYARDRHGRSIGLGLGLTTMRGVPGGGGGPATGDRVLLETGVDFLLLESGDYLLLE